MMSQESCCNRPASCFRLLLSWGALLLVPLHGWSAVTVSPLFADHAILQHGKPVPIWGRARPGEEIVVSYRDARVKAVTQSDGTWQVTLPAMPPGLEGKLVISGENKLEFTDVLTGEVWLCSGQSNMEFSVRNGLNAAAEIAAANFPQIRQFRVKFDVATAPRDEVAGNWAVCSPKTAGYFTAAGYFFAREIFLRHDVPVALINATKGGTAVEAWMSREALASDPAFAAVGRRWQEILDHYPERKAAFETASAQWEAKERAAVASGEKLDARLKPRPPGGPGHYQTPSGTYNAMVAPLIPYALRGVLWYQGEANHTRAPEYRALFTALITDWRKKWGAEDLPFFYVQIPRYNMPTDKSGVMWAYLRQAQTQVLAVPHTAMAVALEAGESDDIHPKNKQVVGHRLALLAREKIYGEAIVSSSPLVRSVEVVGSRMKLEFSPAPGGLKTRDGGEVASLQIAGADRRFFPATGRIEGTALWVESAAVSKPVAVRYAWSNDPKEANLESAEGLSVGSFRTDDWPDFPGTVGN